MNAYSGRLRIEVTNTNNQLLEWLRSKFSGGIRHVGEGVGRWSSPRRHLHAILQGVLPYLITKRDQAIALIRLVELSESPRPYAPSVRDEQETLSNHLRKLKEESNNFKS